ncbi:uncharacterized protein LOC124444893 [Xenia sp. Carnegie-2017]|uniref:uncharacterized protein LOC124444893 n=1 Tax=Xenia sp. Carnegie-2017 TaxID=2897299 RepID=UPI001F03CDA5|nr:uncharacterized protein LOC124444893 [Xenia sp. Carnegie-2017]XP_046851525.1 uncharacterized protein LOC124444893 [Xenia sp. Carnegie-2017]XP_046851526.1 uncharacterized protein LOC124444893 [Xenia sp. Carnegie-2017]
MILKVETFQRLILVMHALFNLDMNLLQELQHFNMNNDGNGIETVITSLRENGQNDAADLLRITIQVPGNLYPLEEQERNLCSRLESAYGRNRQNTDSLPEICFRLTRNGNLLQQEQGFQQETQPSNDRHLPQAERQGENNEQSRHHGQNNYKKTVHRNYVHLEEDHSREPVFGQPVEPISSPRLECTTCGRNLEIETSDSSQRNNLKNVLLQIMQNLDERQRTSLLHEICSCTEIENPRRSMQGREVMEFLMGQLHHLRRQGKCIICVLKYALQRIGCTNLVTITRLLG